MSATAACVLIGSSASPVMGQREPALEDSPDCIIAIPSFGQATLAGDLARLLSVTDTTPDRSFLLLRSGRAVRIDACSAPRSVARMARAVATPAGGLIQLEPAELLVVGNSAYPRDWNDGALWGGRGLGTSMTGGFSMKLGPLSATLMPVVTWQSNADFDVQVPLDTVIRHRYSHPWWGLMIDAPQRLGEGSTAQIHPGHSSVSLSAFGLSAGVSTQNIIWGPARRNPLLLSATAPGFPHAFLETDRAIDIWIGRLEAQLFWGRLTESDYFDADPANDERLLAGVLVAFEPRPLPGLTIGAGRTQSFTWWESLSLSEVLLRPYRGISENPQGVDGGDNQLITIMFRWSAAPWGLEAYGEWAREDHWGTWTELLRNLDASQAWTLGLQKIVRRGDDALRIAAEVTHLADALPVLFAARGVIPFYSNSSVIQGHTHRGQMLGAPIGTGAEAQWLGVDYFWHAGRTSLSVERARYEDDAYYAYFAPRYSAHARDAEFSVRGGHALTRGALALDAELGWSRRYNRSFLGLGTDTESYRREHNLSLRLGARWTP